MRELEASEGIDILVDAGRLGLLGSPEPLLAEADVTLVVTDSGLPELAAVRGWLPTLAENAASTQLVLVDPGNPYTGAEIERELGVPVLVSLPWEPSAARWWSHGEPHRRHDRTNLAKAVANMGARLRELVPSIAAEVAR